ncbi:MAG: hypothetical protein ACD_62C00229G0004 [uncultured bacterium]|nr:MAG: hypothetical protein ACD_62C00229G0004 [uncultured bacterium]
MIYKNAIVHWRVRSPWKDDAQVEQDLLLTAMIVEMFSDPLVAEQIALRGGTCLNKLFWPQPTRYSEDIDLVQINAGKIGGVVQKIRLRIDPLLGSVPAWEKRRNGFRLYYRFQPEQGGAQKNIKIEINTREHFSVEGFLRKSFAMESPWKTGSAMVTTYSFNELMATKLRALYQRKKGRDLYDLWRAEQLRPDWDQVVRVFAHYMDYEKKKITKDLFCRNLEEKMRDRHFLIDTQGLLLSEADYDPVVAAEFVTTHVLSRLV